MPTDLSSKINRCQLPRWIFPILFLEYIIPPGEVNPHRNYIPAKELIKWAPRSTSLVCMFRNVLCIYIQKANIIKRTAKWTTTNGMPTFQWRFFFRDCYVLRGRLCRYIWRITVADNFNYTRDSLWFWCVQSECGNTLADFNYTVYCIVFEIIEIQRSVFSGVVKKLSHQVQFRLCRHFSQRDNKLCSNVKMTLLISFLFPANKNQVHSFHFPTIDR